ncbi:hypothetical protein SAMN04488128_101154 [Chitinophaga eiseniae]|uniref:Uncharacterized protein n=1 Tax=Chitinophaga eiseniae TaxID=634771 RepID=A0A1T4KJI9_9BACT|nr:hypothetical protein [Chitinophaga eiseniae]SJZ42570.1 hypothetical protein SAMN04488128_101154 [Chitinophaga eiseniae]
MRYLLFVLLFVSRITANAQQLPFSTVDDMARKLRQLEVLTPAGQEELVRFAQGLPLRLYQGLDKMQVPKQAVFVAEADFLDILPGQTHIPPAILDSLAAIRQYPWSGHDNEFAEARFLSGQFPSRHDLFNFLLHSADYYRFNYDSSDTLTNRLLSWFGPAMAPYLTDSTLELAVSDQTDTPEAQQERVAVYAPYLRWVDLFRQAGFLPETDSVINAYYHNGKNIYGSVSHTNALQELGRYITYLDKYPYLKQQQLLRLDTLQQSGLIDGTEKQQIITRYKPCTLLSSDDILSACKTAVPLYTATDILPYDLVPQHTYGQIPVAAIRVLYQRVTDKISRQLFPLTATDIRVQKATPDADGLYPYQEQLALSRSAKILSATLRLNGRLYRETIDEKEFESWIRPENFQFLNHYLEDRHDPRRFYFITPNRFTRYEPLQPDTVYLALLTRQQAGLLQSPYLFGRIEGCYNGSPGDYDYAVYPYQYFDTASRLTKVQIDSLVTLCRSQGIFLQQDTALLQASIREHNPVFYQDALSFSPACFSSAAALPGLLPRTQDALRQLRTRQVLLAVPETMENADACSVINEALGKQGVPFRLYQLANGEDSYGDQRYILLKPAAAAALKTFSPGIFAGADSGR